MDGIHLDTRVHWRAGMKTYAGRADLVVPFLLNTDETSDILGVLAADNSSPLPSNKIGDDISASKVPGAIGLDEPCPWCGADTLGTETANTTVSYTKDDDCGLGGAGGMGHESEDLASTSHIRDAAGPAQDSVGNGRSSRRSACASCGFTFPDTRLWSVSESRTACVPLHWDDVCSAGDRWRYDFCLGVSSRDTNVRNKQEEVDESNDFRNACLRERAELTNMRRRHRCEKRDVTTSVDINGAEPRAMNGGGGGTSKLASMVPSRQRLEVELELGEQHAEERKDQAARQLCFHGGGVERADMDSADKTCVVVNLSHLATEGHQQEQRDDLPDTFEDRHRFANPAHRQSRAARVLQRLWHRHKEPTAPSHGSPSRRGLESGSREPAKEQAVTKLQSAFRGFHVRRALQVNDWTSVTCDFSNLRRAVPRQLFTPLNGWETPQQVESRGRQA